MSFMAAERQTRGAIAAAASSGERWTHVTYYHEQERAHTHIFLLFDVRAWGLNESHPAVHHSPTSNRAVPPTSYPCCELVHAATQSKGYYQTSQIPCQHYNPYPVVGILLQAAEFSEDYICFVGWSFSTAEQV